MSFLRVVCLLFPAVLLGSSSDGESVRGELPLENWLPALWEPARSHAISSEGMVEATALPSAASHFIALNPCRVVDTRRPDGAHGGPILTGGVSRTFNVPAGPCAGIPAASAYSLNVAVTGSAPGAGQFLIAWPAGTTRPLIATMNFNGGSTVSNAAVVPADGTGTIEIYASATTHVIVDINGYVKEGVVTSITPGAGAIGGGTGDVTLGLADGGVGAAQIGASAVSTGAIQDGAVTGAKIANSQVVRNVNGLNDGVDIVGAGGISVTTAGSTITVGGATPSGTMILGEPDDTTLIGAGYTELGPTELEHWQATATAGAPSGRYLHTAVWTGTKMIVFGGYANAMGMNTGGQYDPAANVWTATSTTGAPPGRDSHTAVWTGTKMIVWGGSDGVQLANTGGRYDPVGNSWSSTTTVGAPSGRYYHAAVWTGTKMIVWGGYSSSTAVNTGGQYDPVGNFWTATNTTGAPTGRHYHTAVWTGTKMIVWGGSGGGNQNTGGLYDPASDLWTATTTTNAPSARFGHKAVWSGTRMIVWGGYDGTYANTGGRYDPVGNSWSATTAIGAPSGRTFHTAVWAGTKMIVWGGFGGATNFDTGALYDPQRDLWSPTTTVGVPSGRQLHTAVWTGTKMIVWGGGAAGFFNSGARWGTLSLYRKN